MNGAIDFFSGNRPLGGGNLWQTDHSPLDQLDNGPEDVIGEQAKAFGSSILTAIQGIVNAILGFEFPDPVEIGATLLGTVPQISQYFGTVESFLGNLNPLDPNFSISAAAQNFINLILLPENILANLVDGFLPFDIIPALDASNVPFGQFTIDRILGLTDALDNAVTNWEIFVDALAPGTVGGTQTQYVTAMHNIRALLGNPDLISPTFSVANAAITLVEDVLEPTSLIPILVEGILDPSSIPLLDASKLATGIIDLTRLPDTLLTDTSALAAALITGTLDVANIPHLPADQITSGILDLARLPGSVLTTASSIAASAVSGLLSATNIPGLDASKIITGNFTSTLIPTLDASKIGTGVVDIARLPSQLLTNASSIAASAITGILSAANIPGLDVSKIVSGVFGTSVIPSLPASQITSGTFGTGLIPSLPASQITSGTFGTGLIPGLDASKIISGVFNLTQLPASVLTTASSVAASAITGVLTAGNIPGLDVSKIITGTFGTGFIPNLDVAKITTGTFGASFIPGLDASKIISGALALTAIPGLPTSKITSGTFLSSILPMFSLKQGAGSNLVINPDFENAAVWNNGFNAGVQSTDFAHSGTTSRKVTGNAGFQAIYLNSNDASIAGFKTAPGEVFRVGAWIYPAAANVGTGGLNLMLNTVNAAGTFIANTGTTFTLSTLTKGAWNYIEAVITTVAGAAAFNPMVYFLNSVPAGEIYYVDDVLVREETQPQSIIQRLFGGTSVLTSILATVVPGLDLSKITTGLATGMSTWLGAGGALPSATTLAATGLTGLATSIGSWLTAGGALPSATTLQGSQLLGSVASSLLSGTIATGIIPGLDASKITSGVFTLSQLPASILTTASSVAASAITGVLTAGNIPGLDVSKIITGTFGTGFIPSLPASQITSGTFTTGLIPGLDAAKITSGSFATSLIPNITKAMSTDLQGVIDNIYQAVVGGTSTGNTLASVKANLLAIPGANIASAVLASIVPVLDASKITTGTFGSGLIPNLAASKITSGVFPAAMLDLSSIAASAVSGTLTAANIPGLDAAKIISGTFGTGLIPNVTKAMSTDMQGIIDNIYQAVNGGVTTGNTLASVKTNLLAIPGANIASAVLASIVPVLDASKITTGVFSSSLIPALATSAITGLTGYLTNLTSAGVWSGPLTAAATVGSNPITTLLGNITSGGLFDSGKLSNVTGTIGASLLSALDASKVTTGTFVTSLIPSLDVAKITTGIFGAGFIPGLDAAKIITGTFGTGLIPGLPTSKITSGTFTNAMSPGLLPQSLWQATSQAGSNLIIGPDFEDSTIARNVGSYGTLHTAAGAYSTAQKHSGTQSFALTTSTDVSGQNDAVYFGVSTYGTLFDQEVRCQPGQWYYTEIYVLAKSTNTTTTGNINLQVLVNDSNGVNAQIAPQLQSVAASGLSSSVWTKLSGWYQVPAGYDRICPFVGSNAQNVAAQVYYFDDIRFNENTQGQAVTQQLWGGSTILTSLLAGVIPGLDAAKIITGTFPLSLTPLVLPTSFWGATRQANTNLIISPDFSDATVGRGPAIGTGGSCVYTSVTARSGTSALQFTGGTASGASETFMLSPVAPSGWTDVNATFKTQPGQTFYGEIYVKAKATNTTTAGIISISCFYQDTTGVNAQGLATFTPASGAAASVAMSGLSSSAWTKLSGYFTMPAGYDRLMPFIWLNGANVGSQVWYFDDALMREETVQQSIITKLWGAAGSPLTNILATVVPGLDASKIITGVLSGTLIPNLAASIITSGTFGSGLIPGLDASKIITGVLGTGVIPNLPISQILTLPGQLSTMFSPFNPPQSIGPGQITVAPQNLLKNWNFPDATSMAGETVWVWDAATNAAPGGSAKVNVAINTNTKALQSDPIQVVAKDTINASAWTQWSSLTYTGTPIGLMLNLYDASNALLTQITLATATMTGATSSWVQLAGAYTIPDASTAVWARLVYNVSTTATAGSVWFTNGSFTKPNPIPQTAVQDLTGILGGANVGDTIQDFVDKGVQGIVNDVGTLTGQSLAAFNQQISNMARFLGFVTSGAAPTNSVAQIASAVDNTVKARAVQKAFNENIDPTTDATFPLSNVWQNATLPTVQSTAGATVMGDITIRDGGDKNAVTWYGYPTSGAYTNITDFRVNVYSINKTTNVRTKVHGSINLIGSATPPGTGSAPVFNSYNLPASIVNTPGDRLTAEIAILGTGTYNVVGQTISAQIPFHSVYGLHGLTRASAAAPTTANPPGVGGSPLSYSRAIPWLGMSGVQSATQFTPVTIPYYGSDSFNPSTYQWANYMDIMVCGPGGRGANGSGYWGGMAGHEGAWGTYAGLPKSVWGAVTTSISITAGQSQTASTVTVPGWGTISGPGGANEVNVSGTNNFGQAPAPGAADAYVSSIRYPGGAGGASPQANGAQPGGAGAGGNAPFTVGTNIYGGNGGDGMAYLRLYQ
jgi:hypothetical protein